jgi:hypothetical protein
VSLARLFEDEESFYYVMDRIAEGKEPWLDVAVRLAPSADAHPGEELASALARALGNAPEAVLSRSFEPITFGFICSGPGLEEDEKRYQQALERALAAVSGITTVVLAAKRDACVKLLTEAKAGLATKEHGE